MDIQKLMKQAETMQKKMQEMQTEIAQKKFEGKSGGGLISIIMNGNGEICKIDIDPSLLKQDEKEILEDLVIAAYNEAKTKLDAESKSNMSGTFGDFGDIPQGINF